MSKKKGVNQKGQINRRLSVSKALDDIESLKKGGPTHFDITPATGEPEKNKESPETLSGELSNEELAVNANTGTGFLEISTSGFDQTQIMRAIEVGDKDTASTLRDELSNVKTTFLISSITIMLAIAAILVVIILYLHSDIKSELNDIREEISGYFENLDTQTDEIDKRLEALEVKPDSVRQQR